MLVLASSGQPLWITLLVLVGLLTVLSLRFVLRPSSLPDTLREASVYWVLLVVGCAVFIHDHFMGGFAAFIGYPLVVGWGWVLGRWVPRRWKAWRAQRAAAATERARRLSGRGD